MNTLNLIGKNKSETPTLERQSTQIPPAAYHEVPSLKHETKDVLKQLNANIQLLDTMTARLGFVLSEVRGIIRR